MTPIKYNTKTELSPYHEEVNDLLDALDTAIFDALTTANLTTAQRRRMKRKVAALTLEFEHLIDSSH